MMPTSLDRKHLPQRLTCVQLITEPIHSYCYIFKNGAAFRTHAVLFRSMGLSQLTQPENAVLKVGLYEADQLHPKVLCQLMKLRVGEGLRARARAL